MIELVKLKLELSTENPEVTNDLLGKLAEILQCELVDRLKLGADNQTLSNHIPNGASHFKSNRQWHR